MDWKNKLDRERDLKNKEMVAAKANGEYERQGEDGRQKKKKIIKCLAQLNTVD